MRTVHYLSGPGSPASLEETIAEWMRDPPCDDPLRSVPTDDALRRGTLEVLERRNIIGVLSRPPDLSVAARLSLGRPNDAVAEN